MSLVLLSITEGVATLTLNNPDERNTLTAPMVAEILAAMDTIEGDPSVGAIVVTRQPGLEVAPYVALGIPILDCTGAFRGIAGVEQL